MKNMLSLKELHAELAPTHDVTIRADEVETINIIRVAYIAEQLGYFEFARLGYFIKEEYIGKLIKEIKGAISDYDGEEELEYTWLESTNEYVINVGSVVIVDGLTEEAAEGLHDLLLGELEEVVYLCSECNVIHEEETETCDHCKGECNPVTRAELEADK